MKLNFPSTYTQDHGGSQDFGSGEHFWSRPLGWSGGRILTDVWEITKMFKKCFKKIAINALF